MKVIAGLDIPAFYSYGDVNSMMSYFVLGKRAIADRFDLLNKYSPFNFTVCASCARPLPTYQYVDLTFQQYCLRNTENIIKKNPNLYLMWSGGVDSTLILACTKMLGYKIPILCTEDSIREAPLLYRRLCNEKYDINLFANNYNDWHNIIANKTVLTGQTVSSIGMFVENSILLPYLQKPYKDIIREYLRATMKRYGVSNKVDENIEIWEEYSQKVKIPIHTVAEFDFLLRFTYSHNYNSYRIGLMTSANGKFKDNSIRFYETTLSQDYAISHYKENLSKYIMPSSPLQYKQASKNIICKVFPNVNYEQKNKSLSLKHYYMLQNKQCVHFIPQRILRNDGKIDEYPNVPTQTKFVRKYNSPKLVQYKWRENCVQYLKNVENKDLYLNSPDYIS